MTIRSTLLTTAVTFALAGSAFAEGCDKIVFSDVGWTDITATTAATTLILQARWGMRPRPRCSPSP
jgi:glycine betaine/proline transport system substrate-binding protein